jgi:hypothetical protein
MLLMQSDPFAKGIQPRCYQESEAGLSPSRKDRSGALRDVEIERSLADSNCRP